MVELLVSLGILAIVLSATAASLIGFARTALENERRVQTTAQLGGLHEQYQAVPWLWAGVYLDEVEDLADRIVSGEVEDVDGLEFNATTDTWTLDGDDLFVLPGPCPDDSLPFDTCRVDFVPRAYEELEVDDRDYEVIQLVTERSVRAPDDPDDVDEPDLRRVTTIVRWEVRGRPFEQVFVSERAPTTREQADVTGRPIRQFIVTPRPIQAHLVQDTADDLEIVENDEELRIAARFDRGLFQADVCFLDVDAGSDTFDPVTFDPDSDCEATRRFPMDPVLLEDGLLHSGFHLDLEARAVQFTDSDVIDAFKEAGDGFRDIKVVLVGHLGGGEYLVTDATVQLLDLDDVDLVDGPTAESFELGTGVPFFEPGVVDITGELCDDFGIRVNATGVTDGGDVRVYYATDRSRGLASVPGFAWETNFLAGAVSPWAPRPGSPVRDILYATATNEITVGDGDGTVTRTSRLIGSSDLDDSSDAEFRFSLESNGGCPPHDG